MDKGEIDITFWIKFLVLFIPFSVMIWIYAPTIKWKIMFIPCGAVGILLALAGKSLNPHRR